MKTFVPGVAEVVGNDLASSATYNYLTTDHAGSTRGMWDGALAQTGSWEFTPYGNPYNFAGPPDVTRLFTGHDLDRVTGQYYAPFRFLNPQIGRWSRIDPLEMVNGSNMYSYAIGNPVRNIDALGLEVSASFDLCTQRLRIFDHDTGSIQTLGAESGGKPWGAPIPEGLYDILDHPNPDFFRLEPFDNNYGDDTHDGSGRDQFRLHKPGRTIGCIAAKSGKEWRPARDIIAATSTSPATVNSKTFRARIFGGTERIKKFGTMYVWNSCDSPPPARGPVAAP